MEIIIRVDMKIVKVFYTREVRIEKTAPTPSAPFAVKTVDEERYEQITSHIAKRYENKQLERWFNNYDDAKKYAKTLLEKFKEETLRTLKRQIDESAISVFVKS